MALRLLTENPSARPFSVSPGLFSGKVVLRGRRDATNVARELQRAGPDREKWFRNEAVRVSPTDREK